jgi:hypothetical protein
MQSQQLYPSSSHTHGIARATSAVARQDRVRRSAVHRKGSAASMHLAYGIQALVMTRRDC